MVQSTKRVRIRFSTTTMVQIRHHSLLAATFTLHSTGKSMINLYSENQKMMNAGNGNAASSERGPSPEDTQSGSDILADLHATPCAAEGREFCRRACGDHGYSSFMYFITIYFTLVALIGGERNLAVVRWLSPYNNMGGRQLHIDTASHTLPKFIFRPFSRLSLTLLAPEIHPFRPERRKACQRHRPHPLQLHSRANIGAAFDVIRKDEGLVAAFAL
ncbi:hypothetical protein K469DRAFT_181122 [Zopfia rhizophila CBS 207.26]|uniref:Acyl-CoA oxidase C-alpha1 domain-containing protein n=1 Tax=Zopfia rhizophila CBS 207.26 TaxID=1314779 RepID=A0A6A6E2F4_9PEZI|nr:hypothetical protein K469DRAFT_181122 [Zopfia rhizophila CBS 207.26]